jgi:hypothetical protein
VSAVVGGGALCAVLAAATLRVLRRPLLTLLTELCSGRERAQLWWRVFAVAMVTGTALCTSLAVLGSARAAAWRAVAAMVQGGCVGLMVSLAAVTLGVRAFQRELDRRRGGAQRS